MCSVRQLAALLGVEVPQLEVLLNEQLGEGLQSAEDVVSVESAELAALEFGKILLRPAEDAAAAAAAVPRAPVVTVMGHVDHGKTSLLDALRSSNVTAGEAGGITQHIGAFEVAMPGSGARLTFLDTPGHAAFGAMRARGAAATDIVVLAVAADDGVMPQTREALAHARAAQVPVVVALTKCDLPQARIEQVKMQLLSEGLELEEFGGDVQLVETAARKGQGLDALEEALLLQAEVMELKAPLDVPATGVVVEAQVAKGLGPIATVILRSGTLRLGDPIVVGTEHGRVRAIKDGRGASIAAALPGQAVVVSGLRAMPAAGDELLVVASEARAAQMAAARSARAEDFRLGQADVQGTAEAVREAVAAAAAGKVHLKVVYCGVGSVSASDVHLAAATGARLVAFNLRPPAPDIDAALKASKVEVLQHRVIYHLLDEVEACILEAESGGAGGQGSLAEQVLGSATVLQVFPLLQNRKEVGKVAGCRVQEGSLQVSSGVVFRVLRDGEVVFEGPCSNLRQHKNDVSAVGRAGECGVVLDEGRFGGYKLGDVVQCVQQRTVRG
ncbi:P-loop containing nucleoside triphosphate hydrolase protein [Scenedesmus sp. NREL 46B-D3]|nr:P-loop containing nucleoside triphosphate hydrolase protein [Scenedesmus sp. NREL 46B-D3]